MAKREDLKCDFDIQKAGVVCFTESHLGKSNKITPNEIGLGDNMEIFHCDRESWRRSYNMCTFYRSSTYSCQTFMQKLGEVLNDYTDSSLCIVGNFNKDILENSDKLIHKTFLNAGFTQHVKLPTRDSGTLLNHVYTHHMQEVEMEVSDTYFSDHDAVYCYIKVC